MDTALSRLKQHRMGRSLAFATWLILVLGAFALAAFLNTAFGLRPGPNEYNLADWETHNFANKWLYGVGEVFRGHRNLEQENNDLVSFFGAVDEVKALEKQPRPEVEARLRAATEKRDRLENRAEAVIEGRITRVAEQKGLKRGLWLLPDMVWPPVDLELTTPPETLAVSARARIQLIDSKLLKAGLSLSDLARIEHEHEAKGNVSALAFPLGGVGAYPTIVAYDSDYGDLVQIAAHEWTHNYLAFRPLGLHYYENNELRTINETVADVVGKEIADSVVEQWPLPQKPALRPSAQPQANPQMDLRAELVKLRGEVDALLAQGKVDDAERLMEDRRQYLAANGYFIRRINQAYFAFINLYAGAAGSPGAVNPIGPKVDELRRRAGSLAAFLRVVGGVTSVEDLDRALASVGAQ